MSESDEEKLEEELLKEALARRKEAERAARYAAGTEKFSDDLAKAGEKIKKTANSDVTWGGTKRAAQSAGGLGKKGLSAAMKGIKAAGKSEIPLPKGALFPFIFMILIHFYDAIVLNFQFTPRFTSLRIMIYIVFMPALWLGLCDRRWSEQGNFIKGALLPIVLGFMEVGLIYSANLSFAPEILQRLVFITSPWMLYLLGIMLQEEGAATQFVSRVMTFGYIMLLLITLYAHFSGVAIELQPDSSIDVGAQAKGIQSTVTKFMNEFGKGMGLMSERALRIAVGEDIFAAYVEENEQQPVGVFLNLIPGAKTKFREGDAIKVRARIKAVSAGKDSPIERITLGCVAKQGTSIIEGTPNPQNLESITATEEQDIVCEFDPVNNEMKKGNWDVTFFAKFDFEVLGDTVRHFIDFEDKRQLEAKERDPFSEYGITDRNPLSKSTGGPLSVGMGTADVLIGLPKNEEREFTFGVTFDRYWTNGKYDGLNSMVLKLPESMEIKECDYNIKSVPCVSQDRNGCENEKYTRVFELQKTRDESGRIPGINDLKSETTPFTITCSITADHDATLGEFPTSTEHFKVVGNYDYIVELRTPITVTDPLGTEPIGIV